MIRFDKKYDHIDLYLDGTYENKTIKDFFDEFFISKKNRYIYKVQKTVLLNKQEIKDDHTVLHKKDCITIMIPKEELNFIPSSKPCKVVYEDEFVYVVHKDAPCIIHGDKDETNALANMAARYQLETNITTSVRYIHRLDELTTGLVLFVKIPFFQSYFDHMLEEKEIQRFYYAMVIPARPLKKTFVIDQPIGRDRHNAKKYLISKSGKEATTSIETVANKNGSTLLRCKLHTGRTHQIRVHLNSVGCPIINDPLYGVPSLKVDGMGLWAYCLIFKHPLTKQEITVMDSMPKAFNAFKKEINR